ncbi:hypothetical protein BJY52DRAFT_851170 [Lactarius psammicola]|nr:hypothetical protein BJY52DRAFT_851170 [Lactarius psammicola]
MRLLFFSICDPILTTHPSSTTPASFQSPTVFNLSIPSFGSVNAGCWGQTCVQNVRSPFKSVFIDYTCECMGVATTVSSRWPAVCHHCVWADVYA